MTADRDTNRRDAEMPGAATTASARRIAAFVGWAAPACIAASLLWPVGMAASVLVLMAFGAWCFFSGAWRWKAEDAPSAVMNATFALYAFGSAGISWWHADPLPHFEQYLPFLGAGLLAIGLRVAAIPPFRVAAAFAVAALAGAAGSIFQVLGATGTYRANFYAFSTWFGAIGALYAVACGGMLLWAARSRAQETLIALGALGGIAVALLSGSKGSWLALGLATPLLGAIMLRDKPLAKIAGWLALCMALVGAAVLAPHSPVIPRIRQAVERHGDPERMAFWEEAVGLARSHPALGAGRQAMIDRLAAAQLRLEGVPLERPHNNAHNEYLDILATRGVAGLALALAALAIPAAVFLHLWRRGPVPLAAATGLVFVLAFATIGAGDVQFAVNSKRMTYLFFVLFCATCASPPQATTTRKT